MENKMKMPANLQRHERRGNDLYAGRHAFGAVSALAGTAFSIWNLYNYYKGMVTLPEPTSGSDRARTPGFCWRAA